MVEAVPQAMGTLQDIFDLLGRLLDFAGEEDGGRGNGVAVAVVEVAPRERSVEVHNRCGNHQLLPGYHKDNLINAEQRRQVPRRAGAGTREQYTLSSAPSL